jgi:Metallo-beta-lactamase superfamily
MVTNMLMLDRRTLLRAGSTAVAIGAAALAPTAPALTRAPQVGKQAQPSFYRFKLGTIEITVVSDGTLAFPAETLWGDRAEDARSLLTSTFQPSSPVGLQINTILVNTGDKLVLIDAGCGVDKFQKTTGGLLGNLAAAGYAPGDIDMILFTHCHFDHLWGISDGKNASLLFPSAEFVASETEVAFWSAPELPGKVSPNQQPLVTQANLRLASPRLRLIKAGAEVAPGASTPPVTRQGISRCISVPASKKCSSPATSWSTRRSASCIRNGRSGSTWTYHWQQRRARPSSTAQRPTRRWSVATIYPSLDSGT